MSSAGREFHSAIVCGKKDEEKYTLRGILSNGTYAWAGIDFVV